MSRKSPRSVLIIESRFYEDIADELARGALAELEALRIDYERIALGCVIRGETSHYEIVARESAAGLHTLAVEHAVPLGNGILTCDSREQALARASVDGRNKGGDAARACLALMQLEQHFSSASRR